MTFGNIVEKAKLYTHAFSSSTKIVFKVSSFQKAEKEQKNISKKKCKFNTRKQGQKKVKRLDLEGSCTQFGRVWEGFWEGFGGS